MKVSLKLCLLFSLISPVVLLKCKKCLKTNKPQCPKARDEQCDSDSSCRTLIYNASVIYKGRRIKKSCFPSASCDPGFYSFTTSGGRFINMLADCCSTDNCNSKNLEFSSEPMEPNGLECKGCYAEGRGTCYETEMEMVKCLGEQTKCISMNMGYRVLKSLGVLSAKGCATPLMCDPRKWKKNMDFIFFSLKRLNVNCTDPILTTNVSSLA